MAVAYISIYETLVVFCRRGELKAAKGRTRNPHWPLIAFNKLADMQEDYNRATVFVFDLTMRPAVERILKAAYSKLEMLEKIQCEDRLSELESGNATTLHPSRPRKSLQDT